MAEAAAPAVNLRHAARLFATVRYLTPEQWMFRVIVRGQRALRRRFPQRAFVGIRRTARSLPMATPLTPGIQRVAPLVLMLQNGVHADFLDGIEHGEFTFLNRTVSFGGSEAAFFSASIMRVSRPSSAMTRSEVPTDVP